MAALLKISFRYYKHDSSHKYCNFCLEKFRIELLKNIDLTLMFENNIRDEITQAVKRYAKAIMKEKVHLFAWEKVGNFTPKK